MAWKKWTVALLAALLVCGVSGTGKAWAAGVGFAFEGAGGDGEQEWETDPLEYDSSSSRAGFGFVFDTNVLGSGTFNYRMNIMLERQTFEIDDTDFETDLRGMSFEQDFGFGGNVTPNFRLWGGPSLRLSYHGGEDDLDYDYSVWGIGIGPVLGANIALNDRVALTGKVGVMMSSYGGTAESPTGVDYDYDANDTSVFFNFGILFQTGR